jgi:hypothetical protein
MIAGTMIFEDVSLQWKLNNDTSEVTYTVCDAASGKEVTRTVDVNSFAAAMGIALSQDGEAPNEHYAELAEHAVFGLENNLRWIP